MLLSCVKFAVEINVMPRILTALDTNLLSISDVVSRRITAKVERLVMFLVMKQNFRIVRRDEVK